MEVKEMKAEISKKFSKSAWILLACWIGFFLLFTIIGFTVYNKEDYYPGHYTNLYWYGIRYATVGSVENVREGSLVLVLFINLLLLTLVPLIYYLIGMRKRKLSELIANEKEIIGSYAGFIPISKITLKMPIEKVDNIVAVKNFFFLYTGKALRIASTSGVIRIPYVLNADEVVSFLSEGIEKARKKRAEMPEKIPEKPQVDVAEGLKKFAELRDAGIITEEEFQQKKKELLG